MSGRGYVPSLVSTYVNYFESFSPSVKTFPLMQVKGFLIRKLHSDITSVFTENSLERPTFLLVRLRLQPQLRRHQFHKIWMRS